MPIRLFFGFFLILSLICVNVVAAAKKSPTEQVRVTIGQIMAILQDQSLNWEQRQAKIMPIVDERFDFRSMSQSVLATHWRRATPAERERFVEFFSQYLEHTYMEQIEKYSDEYVKYGGEKIRGDRAVVDTYIVTEDVEIPVSYKLRLKEGEWYAYDVVIEQVSLISNYRNIYSAIVKTEGIGGLLDDLEEQNQRLRRLEKTRRTN